MAGNSPFHKQVVQLLSCKHSDSRDKNGGMFLADWSYTNCERHEMAARHSQVCFTVSDHRNILLRLYQLLLLQEKE